MTIGTFENTLRRSFLYSSGHIEVSIIILKQFSFPLGKVHD